MPKSSEALIVEQLGAGYDSSDGQVEVFRAVSFQVQPGEVLGIFGSNGSGKSTLLRTIAGLKAPLEGRISFPSATAGRASLSFVPQDFRASFFNWMSLAGNVHLTLPSPIKSWRTHTREIDAARQGLEINVDMRLRPHKASGGMLQQAALVRAFSNDPCVLLADEPFSALDFNVARKVRSNFRRIVRERGIISLLVLHSIENLVEICDRILVIPNPPFSTEELDGYYKARFIQNQRITERPSDRDASTFVQLAERVFGSDYAT